MGREESAIPGVSADRPKFRLSLSELLDGLERGDGVQSKHHRKTRPGEHLLLFSRQPITEQPPRFIGLLRSDRFPQVGVDRKSTRLNSSHVSISYAVFC